MAAKTTKKKTSSKSAPKKPQKQQQNTELKEELIMLAILAASILLVISNFGLGGIIGEAISSVTFGMFGYMAYLFPFAVFGATAFLVSNRGNAHAYIKAAAGAVLFLVLTALSCLIFDHYYPHKSLITFYLDGSLRKNAGGFAGGCLTHLLCPLIGVAGTYVVLIILLIMCIILITEKALLAPLGRKSRQAYEEVRVRRRETAAIRLKERESKALEAEKDREALRREAAAADRGSIAADQGNRKNKKVSGVSFATTLSGYWHGEQARAKKSPEMREMILDENQQGYDPAGGEDTFVIHRSEKRDERAYASDGLSGQAAGEQQDAAEQGNEKKRRSRKSTKEESAEVAAQTASVEEAVKKQELQPPQKYEFPPISLLKRGARTSGDSDAHLRATAMKLEQTLRNFGVGVHVTNASCGPSVTRYELQPEQGVKVSRIVGLADDIKLNLAVADLRIEAPIPGKAAVGIEVPNEQNTAVMLRDLLESSEFRSSASQISFAVGKDISGKVMVSDIAKMPHLLVAGATGSGKSVCINTLIMSIIYKANPDEVKLILVDPKVVELSVYNGIPHLMIPVVTDPKKAAGALNWAVAEMEKRYKLFAEYNVRDLKGFNKKVEKGETGEAIPKKLPQIVIIIDELADLMMVAPGEVEGAICRLAQLARAAGIHLILATQRPSVNVITGLIKANMPSRIAFSVSSGVDSRTIIDMVGAEKLLGKGDMLFYPAGYPKPVRVQGSFVSDEEVQSVVDYLIHKNGKSSYSVELEEEMNATIPIQGAASTAESGDDRDTYFADAGRLIIEKEKASIGMLQRMFKIGFNRAARIMDQLSEAGVVGPEEGTKPRKVLMNSDEFEAYLSAREQGGACGTETAGSSPK